MGKPRERRDDDPSASTQATSQRTRALAQCAAQLDRLIRLARELEVREIFDIGCEFFANAIRICRAQLVVGSGVQTRTLHWQSLDAPPAGRARSAIELPLRDRHGVMASLGLELLDAPHADDGALAEAFMSQLCQAIVRSRNALAPRSDHPRSGTRPAVSVLVVEHDDDVFSAVCEILELDGFRVRRATNGSEALGAMRIERPSVVVLALALPVMDGLEVRRRQLTDPALREIPLIVVAAPDEGPFDGGVVVLGKPFAPEDLSAEVAKAVLREAAKRQTG